MTESMKLCYGVVSEATPSATGAIAQPASISGSNEPEYIR